LEDAPFDEAVWKSFAQTLFYVPGDFLFYLSTQLSYYAEIVLALGEHKLNQGNGWRRVIIEKPFGHDLESARKLNEEIHKVFDESEVYRIDHYLGKETVQNILAFQFGNSMFEPLWNPRYVDNVQITAAESIGVEGRGAYYQEAGALRDMIQNHLSQVMATVAMEPPAVFEATAVRNERAKLLRSVRIMKPRITPRALGVPKNRMKCWHARAASGEFHEHLRYFTRSA
jgi:glucose-6-phosphate 1-dehydrogenase